ncbi:MAG: valine--pyruvate aminotransferase [Kiritimatiellia bacterium]|jgi:valine--pyruvate aminotransferase
MKLRLSKFGEKLCASTGILELMDDLGNALSGDRKMLMLGGGNPAAIPEVQAIWRARMTEIMADGTLMDQVLVNYDTPQGRPKFIHALVDFINRHYGWNIGPDNIAITNGSQNAFFYLFNMLAGEFPDGTNGKILLPLAPEYIGYADQGLNASLFTARRPCIEIIDQHTFKYHIDFDALDLTDDITAICVSRPTNPSGNVLTDEEIEQLSAIAKARGIPLLIDNAYGVPFPGILFKDTQPIWDEHIIFSLSLSKLGLPGTRTGIVIAAPEIAQALSNANAVASLANGNLGQELVAPLLEDDRIIELSQGMIRPFYQEKSRRAQEILKAALDDDLPYYLHASEGALFLWLWCKDLPITSKELYKRLKDRGVVVVSGHYFFYGLDEDYPQRNECIRINYSQSEEVVSEGLQIIAEEVTRAYRE